MYDISGYDISGEPVAEAGIVARANLGQPVASVRQPGGPRTLRRQISPFARTLVPPTSVVTVTLTPQRAFRCERLVMSSDVAKSLLSVQAITIGAQPQFVNDGDAPFDMFLATAFGTTLRGDTANPGTTVSVKLSNASLVAENVLGAFIGEAIEI